MSTTLQRPARHKVPVRKVTPSSVDPAKAKPFTLEQELEPFGRWVGEPIWVPPKKSSTAMAETMLKRSGLLTSRDKRWASVINEHRTEFTQVREIDLAKASIRLPKGKFFVSVTEREHFDTISDPIPDCVQTRLDEFLDGPGKQKGVKVYYLKPLCVEVGDDLILTTQEDVMAAVKKIQDEVFAEYRRLSLYHRPIQMLTGAANLWLALPRSIVSFFVQRRQRALDVYQARLELERRRTALRAAREHRGYRSGNCTFDDMLALTNPLERVDVIEQYAIEKELSRAKRDQLIRMAVGTIPWFVTLSVGVSYLYSLSLSIAPPLLVADPAFVAEMPGSRGVVLRIGHFDEVDGVTHVEI